jgi:hypothetical protein
MSLSKIAEFVNPQQEITIAENEYLGKRISIIPFTPAINTTINSALNPRTSSRSYGLPDRNNELWFVRKSATASCFTINSPSFPTK